MELFRLFGTILIKNDQAKKSIKETTGDAEDSQNRMVSAFKKIGTAIGTYIAVDKIKQFGSECVEMSSDVQEMQNKFDVVFQGMTEEVSKWADTYAKAIGRNSNTIKGYLADNQNMFVGMGMTRDQGAKLSEQMVSLALDLASFNNLNETDAVNAFSKAIMGETESAKTLGAVLNENTRALAMEQLGYKGKFESLTEAQKMEVNYQAILNQSADAVGDCERSLDSYKGRQIQATAAVENLKEKIGTYLLPTMTKFQEKVGIAATWLSDHLDPAMETVKSKAEQMKPVIEKAKDVYNDLADAAGFVGQKFSEVVEWGKQHKTAVELIAIAVGTLTAAIAAYNVAQAIKNAGGIVEIIQLGILAVQLGALTVAQTVATAATTAFGVAVNFLTSPITLAILAIGALIAVGVLLYKNWDTVKAKAQELWTSIVTVFSGIKTSVSEKISSAKETVSKSVDKIKEKLSFAGLLATIQGLFKNVKDAILKPVREAKEGVDKIVDKLKSAFDFKWKLPNLKLPHLSVTGGEAPFGIGGKGSLPKFNIKWYKKAMDNAMILNEPTVFGMDGNGNFLGGGDAGSEVVVGKNNLLSMIQDAVSSAGSDPELIAILKSIHAWLVKGGMKELMIDVLTNYVSFTFEGREVARVVRKYA